jgi:CheY-like chemotaxis protein
MKNYDDAQKKRTILLVDDDLIILSMLLDLLESRYRVLIAKDSIRAKAFLESENQIDLVIADYYMPGENGIQLLNHVRKNYPQIKRILLSGNVDLETVTHIINNEIVHRIFTKPWENSEILEMIHEIISRSQPVSTTLSENQKVLLYGNLRGINLGHVICLLTEHQKSGILFLKSKAFGEEKVFLKEGRIMHAVSSQNGQIPVLDDLLARNEGFFYFFEDSTFKVTETFPISQQILTV